MPDLKLPQLPDRNPVKLSIAVMPDLHQALIDYAALYAATYGRDEPIAELIPAMLALSSRVIGASSERDHRSPASNATGRRQHDLIAKRACSA